MIYTRLGTSGTKVSVAGLGTWTTFGDSLDDRNACRMVARAIELGCNFFDTADSYAHGRAELVLGEALANTTRDDLIVSTKIFFPRRDTPQNIVNHRLSRKNILRSLESSLISLGTDYIDLMLLHRYDENQCLHEVADALSTAMSMGKVIYWGVSKWPTRPLAELNALLPTARRAVAYQGLHNVLHRDDLAGVRSYLSEAKMSFHGYSPLARGVLTGKYLDGIPEDSRLASYTHGATVYDYKIQNSRVPQLKSLAAEAGFSLVEVALGFCLVSGCDSILLGASRTSQIEQLIDGIERIMQPGSAEKIMELIRNYDDGLSAQN